MIIFLEFLFYFIFFLYKLYSLLDSIFLLSSQGGRIDEYVKKKNLLHITCYLSKPKKYLLFLQSPSGRKHVIISILVAGQILAIKLAFTYFLFSCNFYPIDFSFVTIDLVSLLGKNYIVFILLYYSLSFLFTLYLYFKILDLYLKNKSSNAKEKLSFTQDMVIGKCQEQEIYLSKKGMYQNVVITGSIGSGKTYGAISNFFIYFLNQNIPGLVLDVKGSYLATIKNITSKLAKSVIEISDQGTFCYNPLDSPDISSMEMAHRIIKVLKLISENNNSDSYFLDKAESYIQSFITLMRSYTKEIHFKELHLLVIQKKYLMEKLSLIKKNILANQYLENELFELNSAMLTIEKEFLLLDERTYSIIRSEITRITSIFVSDYFIYQKFCLGKDKLDFNRHVYVLSFSIGKYSKLAKIIATYLKLDFQNFVLSHSIKDRFFLCDEFQEFVNKQDADFFAISREYKCMNVVAMQSYSSLAKTLGNNVYSDVILQNLVNKIWFRNDDCVTIDKIVNQLGKIKKEQISIQVNENLNNQRYSLLKKDYLSYRSGFSKGYQISNEKEDVLDRRYFSQELKTFQAVCLLSSGQEMQLYEKVEMKRWDENEKV